MATEQSSTRVSIVIPTFNQGHFLRAAIDSVFRQNYPDIELVIVDGGSCDETVSILNDHKNRLRWVSRPGIGQTDAINTGLRMASGGIVTCLDPANLHLPHTIRHVVDTFAGHPDSDIVYGDFLLIDNEDAIVNRIKTVPFDHDILLYGENFICRSASFYRRRLIDEIGCFDNSLHYRADYEFLLRAAKRRIGFQMARGYLAAIRLHAGHEMPRNLATSRDEERDKIRLMYARKKVRRSSAMKLLGFIFRFKRRLRLIRRGQLGFMDPHPAGWLKRIA